MLKGNNWNMDSGGVNNINMVDMLSGEHNGAWDLIGSPVSGLNYF